MIPSLPLPSLYKDNEDEQQFVAEMNQHRWLSDTASQVSALRDIPMWLMAANAIVWHGSGVRLPVIGGPQTPWHWGALLACGNRLEWLIPIVYFNRFIDLWKVAAAAAATSTCFWPIDGIAHGEAETFHTKWKAWEQQLGKALIDEVQVWEHRLSRLDAEKLASVVEEATERRKKFALCPFKTEPALQLIHQLNIACELKKVDSKRVKEAIGELNSGTIPKTLSDRKWISTTAKKQVQKRDKFLELFKEREKQLTEIYNQVEAFRQNVDKKKYKNGAIKKGPWKVAHDAVAITEHVEQLLSLRVDEIDLYADWKPIKDLWSKEGDDLWTICDNAFRLEWPGSDAVDYGEKFVLARYFENEYLWASNSKIKQLKSGKLSPSAFYDWVLDRAKSSGKYREVRFGAVAAVARSILALSLSA